MSAIKNWLIEFWGFRELFLVLTFKEIKIRYKQTLLGTAWAILQPSALTIIFTVVFSLFLKIDSGSIPYPIFAYSALLPWTFFSTALSFGALSVVNNGNLVTKVYFPREMLPLSAVGAAFFDFLMAAVVFAVMMIFYKISISATILFAPLIIVSILLLTTGVSLILATLNVLFRDIRFIIPLLLQIWLYLTPIIYSSEAIPQKFKFLYWLNPLAPLIETFRQITVQGQNPRVFDLAYAGLISIVIFALGFWFFKSRERIFADVI